MSEKKSEHPVLFVWPQHVVNPNVLYFDEVYETEDVIKHSWTLMAPNKKIIGGAWNLYTHKIDCAKNAISLFGAELNSGRHIIRDVDDRKMVHKEIAKQKMNGKHL